VHTYKFTCGYTVEPDGTGKMDCPPYGTSVFVLLDGGREFVFTDTAPRQSITSGFGRLQ
jgi:hypothetical protein